MLPVLRLIVAHRFHRAALLALIISGVGVSITAPQLTLFLVDELDASLTVAGFYYLTNLAAPVAGYLIGSWSDRSTERLWLCRWSAVIGGIGWLAMSASTAVWMPFVISVVALSVAGASSAQLYAAARDELSRHPSGMDNRVLATLRMGFTIGWVVGPVLGSWFGDTVGLRGLLVLTAVLTVAKLIPLGRLRVPRHVIDPPAAADVVALPAAADDDPEPTPQPGHGRAGPRELAPLLIFTGLCVLVLSGDTIKFAYLPIYMADDLGVSPALRGAVIAVQPLLELVLMPFAAQLADRHGPLRVVWIGSAMAVAANATYALSDGVAMLFLGQVLMSGTWATLAALGVAVAQHLHPRGVGLASSVYLSAIPLSGAMGGAIGGFGAGSLGLPQVFWIPAGLSALATIGLFVLGRRLAGGSAVTGTGATR